MARYLGPKCKLSRREGVDLSLKSGIKSLDVKARKSPPGGPKRVAAVARLTILSICEKNKNCVAYTAFWNGSFATIITALKESAVKLTQLNSYLGITLG